jgi:hypothetical protein
VNYNPLLSYLIQIFDGYSKFDLNGRTLFFRHFSLRDQNSISILFLEYKEIAVKKGIETQEDIYKRLKIDGTWSDSDDLNISELESYISNLKKTKQKLLLPSQKDKHQELINEEESKLNQLLNKKKELVGICADEFANKMANEEFLRLLLYKDESLKELAFSKDEFGELCLDEITSITNSYFQISQNLNDEGIQKIVLEDFFNMYISSCENSYNFFGKFVYEMTVHQIKLLLYGRIFNNIFQYNDDIPDYMKKDPKAIFGFVDSKKTREQYQNDAKDSDATMLFGATDKDIEILDPNARKVSLSEALAKSGGSLNMEQMMNLMGN